jgi:hypothetical protein
VNEKEVPINQANESEMIQANVIDLMREIEVERISREKYARRTGDLQHGISLVTAGC